MGPRLIPTKVHGVLDYVTGAVLLAAPELFRLKDVPASAAAPRAAGAAASVYSLLTDYELGAVRVIPMRVHLVLDALSGALLAASPWVLGYARAGRRYWAPHAAVGVAEIAAALVSRSDTAARRS
jgi:hypothetical protein